MVFVDQGSYLCQLEIGVALSEPENQLVVVVSRVAWMVGVIAAVAQAAVLGLDLEARVLVLPVLVLVLVLAQVLVPLALAPVAVEDILETVLEVRVRRLVEVVNLAVVLVAVRAPVVVQMEIVVLVVVLEKYNFLVF